MKDLRPGQPVVLYVENNPDDVALFEMAMRKCRSSFAMETAGTVEQAEMLLNGQPAGCGAMPDLILLDYTLDHLENGLKLLQWVHAHPEAASIPVVVYCGDEFPSLVSHSYREGANCFLCKPPNFEGFMEIVQCLDHCLSTKPPCFEPLLRLKMYRAPIAMPLAEDEGPRGIRLH